MDMDCWWQRGFHLTDTEKEILANLTPKERHHSILIKALYVVSFPLTTFICAFLGHYLLEEESFLVSLLIYGLFTALPLMLAILPTIRTHQHRFLLSTEYASEKEIASGNFK